MRTPREREGAVSRALKLICKSPKTQKEIRDYLFKKEYTRVEVDEAMARLEELGYINDEFYARLFTESKSRKLGKFVILNKMLNKGISKDLAKQSVEQIENAEDVAFGLAKKYMASGKKSKDQLYRFLLSKGFDYDVCTKVVKCDDRD